MKYLKFGNMPSFTVFGFGFGGIWEFSPAIGIGLHFTLSSYLYFFISFMGFKVNYYIKPLPDAGDL
jgi:hypothetical protein